MIELGDLFLRWAGQLKRRMKELHAVLGGLAVAHIRSRVGRGLDIRGAPFVPLSPLTRNLIVSRDRRGRGRTRRGGGKPLMDTGQLLRAVQFSAYDDHARVAIGGAHERMIGAVHQYGTEIVPRRAPALFLGFVREAKNRPVFARRVRIPQRRWFGLSEDGKQEIEQQTVLFVQQILRQ